MNVQNFIVHDTVPEWIVGGYRFMSRGRPRGNALTRTPAERAHLRDHFGSTMERVAYSIQE